MQISRDEVIGAFFGGADSFKAMDLIPDPDLTEERFSSVNTCPMYSPSSEYGVLKRNSRNEIRPPIWLAKHNVTIAADPTCCAYASTNPLPNRTVCCYCPMDLTRDCPALSSKFFSLLDLNFDANQLLLPDASRMAWISKFPENFDDSLSCTSNILLLLAAYILTSFDSDLLPCEVFSFLEQPFSQSDLCYGVRPGGTLSSFLPASFPLLLIMFLMQVACALVTYFLLEFCCVGCRACRMCCCCWPCRHFVSADKNNKRRVCIGCQQFYCWECARFGDLGANDISLLPFVFLIPLPHPSPVPFSTYLYF